MLEPKVPAIGAATGFVLSFLTGLVSGASFPIVLLRAFFMAILFGALAVLLRVLLMKFVPDLFGEAPIDTASGESTGNVVNITIDDPGKGNASPGVADIQSSDGLVPDFLAQTASSMASVNSQSDFAEDLSPAGDSVPDAVAARASQTVRQVPVAESAPSGGEKVQRSSDGLDVLPDLQDFIPQKRPDEKDEEDEVEPVVHTGMTNSGFGGSSFAGSGADVKTSSVEAETMAKAIRTILSNDS